MARTDRQDEARRTGDALDRVIDEAVEAALRAGPVDLRAQVLARLDEPADSPRPRRMWLSSPALLPVAGTLLMMAGVGILWQHANEQLGQATRVRGSAPRLPRASGHGCHTADRATWRLPNRPPPLRQPSP